MLPERYVPRTIAKMSKSDRRISIIGRIIEVSESSFVLDDETGKIEIFFSAPVAIEQGALVGAYCTVVDERIVLDVLQPLPGVDLNLLKTVDDLYSRAGL